MSYIVEGNSEMKYGLYYCQNKYRTFRVIYSNDKNYLKKIANILVYEKYQMVYIDTIYNPPKTQMLKYFKSNKLKTFNGLNMLIYQGQKSFYLWNKINPEIDDKLIDLLISKLK